MAALIKDLKQRGMLDDTLVIWTGEFGRTPQINPLGGRDHWPRTWSAALAGGGVRGGQVIGATTADGTEIAARPVTVPDLLRTCCHALRIDSEKQNYTPGGRPISIVAEQGTVVDGLLG